MAGRSSKARTTATDNGQICPLPGAVSYPVTKAVNLAQLIAEISAAAGKQVVAVLVGANADQPLGPDNPQTLWVTPSSTPANVVTEAIDKHVDNPNWGVPEVMQSFNTVLSKLAVDPEADLSSDEQLTLVRGLALRTLPGQGGVV